MAKSLAQIEAQIEKLKKQAESIKAKEVQGVIDRIKAAIAHYVLTAENLGLARRPLRAAGGKAAKLAERKGGKTAALPK
jgi:DNA-binding protein H-NS